MKRGEKETHEDVFDRRKWINDYIKHKDKVNQIKRAKIKVTEIHVGKEKTGKRLVPHFKVIVSDVGG